MKYGKLKVTEQAEDEVEAVYANISISVSGSNFFYGNAALEKCQEVKAAVEALKKVEPDIGIYVDSVHIQSDSGWFSKSSSGTYNIDLKLNSLGKLNEVLGVIMSMDTVEMKDLNWGFDDGEMKIELLKKAMTKAKKKAEAMTSAIGHRLAGIKSCSDSCNEPNLNLNMENHIEYYGMKRAKMKSAVSADIGTEMKGRKKILIKVNVVFYVEEDVEK